MSEYNYQRMLEERLERYERKLHTNPMEKAVLEERIELLHQNGNFTDRLKQLIVSECVSGIEKRPILRLVESPEMAECLDEFQERLFFMTVATERISELDAEENSVPDEFLW
ncbi:hypothetical protein [Pectobacterium carotovorum]|uniref:hypothetical protein n=1 Tax=Pectobacterium carotovorum TaxID=554 RepID=UPI0013746C80|nr:hypothetical protein [Pectobacterium carotovorum]MBL0906747.1 hypothetical protein [Pectobacterium carotovorum]QHP58099.1 hypothetical protein EH204_09025 [Pectobacterium carotovorum subsp. carotovorum]